MRYKSGHHHHLGWTPLEQETGKENLGLLTHGVNYHWLPQPQISFLSRKCFVATNVLSQQENLCRNNVFCRDKNVFVATKDVFVATKQKTCLSRQNKRRICHDKTRVCRDKNDTYIISTR